MRLPFRNLFQFLFLCSLGVAMLALGGPAQAQDLEPRRWSHLPTGLNVIGLGTTFSKGDIFLDPVLEIDDATYELGGTGLVYLRTFGLFGRSARVDVLVPYAYGRWEGLLQGQPASTRRHGFGDPRLRLSMLLYGAPAEDPKTFATSQKSNTVVGAAISVRVPWGEYYPERLINLGKNQWIFRPQLGVTHTRGKWTYEITGSAFIYLDNDEFNVDKTLENDPLWALQGHLIYTFRPGLWASVSTAWGRGADSSVDGVPTGVRTENWLTSLAVGLPINRRQGVKLAWLTSRTQEPQGKDEDTLIFAWQTVF